MGLYEMFNATNTQVTNTLDSGDVNKVHHKTVLPNICLGGSHAYKLNINDASNQHTKNQSVLEYEHQDLIIWSLLHSSLTI